MGAVRPIDYRPDVADEICRMLAGGKSLTSICNDDAYPKQEHVFQWLATNEEFAVKYARAREAWADAEFEKMLDIAGDKDIPPDRARLMIDTRKWALGKMKPKRYGDKIQVGGAEDLPPVRTQSTLDVSGATLEQLEALQALLAGKQE